MALASQSLVSEWLLAKSILTKKYGTRTKRDISSIVPWLRNRGEIFTSLSEGAQLYLILRTIDHVAPKSSLTLIQASEPKLL